MKLTAFLLLVGFLHVNAAAYSQKVSLSVRNKSLQEIFPELTRQTGISIFYKEMLMKKTAPVSLQVKGASLTEVLDLCTRDQPISYTLEGGNIFIKARPLAPPPVITATDTPRLTITGRVQDAAGLFLPGATIINRSTGRVVPTNDQGRYSIGANIGDSLQFSYIGYSQQTIAIRDQLVVNIILEAKSGSVKDVVVVGFGRQKRISLIGAQSSIKAEDLKIPAANLTNAIAGRVAGVIGVQRSGEPGYDGSQIYIRGISTFTNSSPLVLVDGVERTFNNIDPEDIASFTILKDASATAVYGVRGANGVILIETKKGKQGKPQVNAQLNQGITAFTKTPQFADGVTYLKMANEAYANTKPGAGPLYSEEKIQKTADGSDPDLYPNVNWMKEMFNKHGYNRRVNLNASGGSERATYYLSAGYYNETGLYKTDELAQYNSAIKFTRYNFTSNLTLQVFKNTKVDFGASGWISEGNYPGKGTGDIWNAAYIMPPTIIPVKYSNGLIPQVRGEEANPYDMLTQSGYINNMNSQLWSNARITQDLSPLLKGLSAYGMFSFDNYNYHQISRTKTVDAWFATNRDNDGNLVFEQTRVGSSYLTYGRNNSGSRQFYTEAALNYNSSFGKHEVSGMLLYNQSDRTDAFAGNFIDAIPYRYQGVAARATYGYDERYLLELNLGYNGSETFSKESRFGFFPSYGVGWVASNEAFFESLKNTIQFLKFRGSYGIVGNSNIGGRRFAYISTVATTTGYSFGKNTNNDFGGVDVGDYAVDVTWERAKKANLGIELRLLKDALSVTTDFFLENRDGIFRQRGDLPNYAGIQRSPYGNLGAVRNKGVDATITFNKKLSKDLYFEFRGNMVWNRAIVKQDANALWPYSWQQAIGRKLGQRFGLTALGLFQSKEEIANSAVQTGDIQPGDIKYKDMNGDGLINNYDEGPIGYGSIPEIVYGFGPSFSYKGFSVGAWFKGISNVDISLNGEGLQPFQKEGSRGNLFNNITDRWTPDGSNPNPWYPRLTYPSTSNSNYANSTWWIKNGAFIRLQNVELSYTIQQKRLLHQLGISNFRIYAVGYNVATFSDFKLWDVELGDGKGAQYPLLKTYSFGIDCRF
ncbi:SusC/RagA family TonB-linked outer membrane protein [Chitinophaga sp. sic0106]|uniref:SusC/RagA family TonB-linked outer membrane protein n=1 Tax=Chitinophaga sp. sic0106 TaxID=2854785 RepID=UPI001C47E751|nr:SusC/RagA family TonB-linked outer membrane protein [Chitinophaga sp. sic0106]MBV7529454.1 SusC/RagA family TonB-linked outer membrane protein [Chitinophaga sp. sic0106]